MNYVYGFGILVFVSLAIPSLVFWIGGICSIFHGGKKQREQIAKALDCLLNAATGGDYNVMVSERLGRESSKPDGKARYRIMAALVDILFFFVEGKFGHCRRCAAL